MVALRVKFNQQLPKVRAQTVVWVNIRPGLKKPNAKIVLLASIKMR